MTGVFFFCYLPADFWSTLGGKKDYQTSKSLQKTIRPPRLFGCSNKTGRLIVSHLEHTDTHRIFFHLVPKWRNLSSLLLCVSGRRSPRRLHTVWLGHWWCHAPGYLGTGKLSSLSPSLEIPNSWTRYIGRRVTNSVSLSRSSSFGLAKMLMQRKGPGLPR